MKKIFLIPVIVFSCLAMFKIASLGGTTVANAQEDNSFIYEPEDLESYTFDLEDTLRIFHLDNFSASESIKKQDLSKVKHIILDGSFVDLGDFTKLNALNKVETLSLSSKVSKVIITDRQKEVLPSLREITVDEKNQYISSKNNVLYSKVGDKLIYYPFGGDMDAKVAPGTQIIGQRAFKNVPISTIEIPEGVVTIEKEAFMGTKLVKLTLPASFQSLANDAFHNSLLEEIQISPKNTSLCSVDGAIYTKDQTSLYYWPVNKKGENIENSPVKQGEEKVKLFGPADKEASNLTDSKITISKTIEDIFPTVTEISFEEGTEKLGKAIFYYFPNVKKVLLPRSLQTVGEAFVPYEYDKEIKDYDYSLKYLDTIEVHLSLISTWVWWVNPING